MLQLISFFRVLWIFFVSVVLILQFEHFHVKGFSNSSNHDKFIAPNSVQYNNQSQDNNPSNKGNILEEILERLKSVEELLQEIKQKDMENGIIEDSGVSLNNSQEQFSDQRTSIQDKQNAEYLAAYNLIQTKKYLAAELAFAEFIDNYPESELLGQAFFWYAESFYLRKIYNRALKLYLKSYKKFPYSSKSADALLRASLILGEMNKKKDACKLLDKLDEKFPNRTSQSLDVSNNARKRFFCDNINQ